MGIRVNCPNCGKRFWAPTRAEWQELVCRKCDTVFNLEPHERRYSKHRDTSTGETVVRYRETPIGPPPDYSWVWWALGGGAVLIGIVLYSNWNVVVGCFWVVVVLMILGALGKMFEK